jgi:hypothetical protein
MQRSLGTFSRKRWRHSTVESMCFLWSWSVPRLYKRVESEAKKPFGGGVEYLHRDPASSRRRRKRKSQIWDSKIWSRVRRDSDPRKTALARASSIYKRQTRTLVREGVPQKQDRNCQTIITGHELQMRLDTKTYWLTDHQSQCDFEFDFEASSCRSTDGYKEYTRVREWVQLSVNDRNG